MAGGMEKIIVIIAAVVMMLISGVAAKQLVVGDNNGWDFPPSEDFYDNWAAKQNFVVGDTLGIHNVAIVTSIEAYDKCDTSLDSNPELVTQGPYERNLISSGQFYFFCTIDSHCDLGLKFAANIVATQTGGPSPALAPSPRISLESFIGSPSPALAPSPRVS